MLRSIKRVAHPIVDPLVSRSKLISLRLTAHRPIGHATTIAVPGHADMARSLRQSLTDQFQWVVVDIGNGKVRQRLDRYYEVHKPAYRIAQGRGKALEHALG